MKFGVPFDRFLTCIKLAIGCWVILAAQSVLAQAPERASALYFPPIGASDWEKEAVAEVGWDQAALARLLAWLPTKDTRAFIILKDGKIVVEEYWGAKLTGVGAMDQHSLWYWASAGKSLTAALVGIAQQQKILKVKDRTQKYLGEGWTSLPTKREKEIRLIHQLTMTSGLDERVENPDDPAPDNLRYLAKPGARWAYHHAAYSPLETVIENASGVTFQRFFKDHLGDRIGMNGFWQQSGFNKVFYSDARSFARFGLLMLAGGVWDGTEIWSGDYFEKMSQTSQKLNESYGYLTWLNGKGSFKVPGSQVIAGSMIPDAPADMYQAMGKSGQFVMVVPSQNLVIVRIGGSDGNSPVPYALMREIWSHLDQLID